MTYTPLNYQQINLSAGTYSPSMVKSYNNKTFAFWERALFQRACSTINFSLPDQWNGSVKDFFYYCLFKYGYVAIFNDDGFGTVFQPCTLSGYNFYYQPTKAIISNPMLSRELEIGNECELIKLCPDYFGTWDIISYYAEKLSTLDNAINMSIINNKFAYMIGARNKSAGEVIKKALDKINRGEPAIIFDSKLLNDRTDKAEPWQFLERTNLKQSYLTSDQLADFQTLLNNFDTEIGIPTVPYQKKERLVTDEVNIKVVDSTSRSTVWFETLKGSIEVVNKHFNLNIGVELRFNALSEGGEVNE